MQFKAIKCQLKRACIMNFLMRVILEFEIGLISLLMNNKANFVKACVEYD